MKHCQVPGCTGEVAGYSKLCRNHKQAQRRHGDPLQTAVTVHELRPYVARVKARQAKNKESELWGILAARWEALVARSRDILEGYAAGAVCIRHERIAAQQVLALGGAVPTERVVQTALALYLMAEDQKSRFQSDRAFWFELVRRVRGLSDVNAGTYWDSSAGRVKRVYRDLPPRAVQTMASWLVEVFGGTGLILARKEQEEAAKEQNERQRLAAALGALQ